MTESLISARHAALNQAMRLAGALGGLHSETVARRLGLHPSDLECLDVIHLNGLATAGELARASGLTTGAITGVIDRLERAGYVRRERDPADRRRVLVRPTSAARERVTPLYAGLAARMDTLCAQYDPAALNLLLGFFTRSAEILREETALLRRPAAPDQSSAR